MFTRGRRHALTVGIIAGVLVLAACSDGDTTTIAGDSAALPIGGQHLTGDVAAPTADMPPTTVAPWAMKEFNASDDLDPLGGQRTAYRLVGDDDQLQALADRLDAELNPDGAVGPLDAGLWSDTGVVWHYTDPSMAEGLAVSGCDPSGVDCSESAPPTGTSAEEAEAIARDLLDGIGFGLEDAEVTVASPYGVWAVQVAYSVASVPVQSMSASVLITGDGEIISANGYAGDLETVGEYPTVDTGDAVERMNDGWVAFDYGTPVPLVPDAVPVPNRVPPPETTTPPTPVDAESGAEPPGPADGPETTTTTTAPGPNDAGPDTSLPPPPTSRIPPSSQPEPAVVTVVGAEWRLVPVVAWDTSGLYLVPAYLVEGDSGGTYVTLALTEESIEAPDVESPPPTPTPTMTTGPPRPPDDLPIPETTDLSSTTTG